MNGVLVLCMLAAAARYLWVGMHASAIDPDMDRLTLAANARDRGTTGIPDYAAAGVCLGIACALLAHIVSAPAAYAILCLAITCRPVVEQVTEERGRARGRRAAVLQPKPRVDPVLLTWIALAAASTLLLLPSLIVASDRVSAVPVALSCVAMVLLAWRVATAPRLLSGDDVEAEFLLDRMRRIRRTGSVCFTAVACASFYTAVDKESINLSAVGYIVFIALIVWMLVYLRLASRTLVLL